MPSPRPAPRSTSTTSIASIAMPAPRPQPGRRPCERRRRAGFTLIELLVVVAIIAVLAAMLLPVLGRAKARAKRLACLSQPRQIYLGFASYANENDAWYPVQNQNFLDEVALLPGSAYSVNHTLNDNRELYREIATTTTMFDCPTGGLKPEIFGDGTKNTDYFTWGPANGTRWRQDYMILAGLATYYKVPLTPTGNKAYGANLTRDYLAPPLHPIIGDNLYCLPNNGVATNGTVYNVPAVGTHRRASDVPFFLEGANMTHVDGSGGWTDIRDVKVRLRLGQYNGSTMWDAYYFW